MMRSYTSILRRMVMVAIATAASVVGVGGSSAATALGAGGSPAWRIADEALPNSLPAGGSGHLLLQVENTGDASTDGSPVTVVDHLPAGVTATAADGMEYATEGFTFTSQGETADPYRPGNWDCGGVGTSTVTCVNDPNGIAGSSFPTGFPVFKPTFYNGWGLDNIGCEQGGQSAFNCEPGAQYYYESFRTMPPAIGIAVSVGASVSGALSDTATVSGGGAPGVASDHSTIAVSSEPTPFGIEGARLHSINKDGSTDTQAGSHPYATTVVLKFNRKPTYGYSVGFLRSAHAELPAGLVGDPEAYPRCTQKAFNERVGNLFPNCPVDTQVGSVVTDGLLGSNRYIVANIFNLAPGRGEVARFAAGVAHFNVFFSATVSPGPGHRVVIDSREIASHFHVGFADLDFWGVPADSSHDRERGEPAPSTSDAPHRPFLRLPTQCGQPQSFSLTAEAWGDPVASGPVSTFSSDEQGNPVVLGGCEHLDFSPTVEVAPTSTAADSPTGVGVDVRSPQREHEEDPAGLAEADLKNAVVSLPAGVTVNPSAANGLGACSEAQIELEGSGAGSCPSSSKVGTVEVEAPALDHVLPGVLYLARQDENPFHSLLAGYIVVDDPVSGVVVKLAGELRTDPVTGQITGVFRESPQFPISNIKLKFFNELATPQSCGSYTATSDLTPWSTPGTADATPSSSFQVTSGVGGGGCPGGVLGFAPGFSAGTTSNQAGAFSAFNVVFDRADGEQHLSGVSVKTPPGLLARLAGVPLCGEPQAGLGQCPAASMIGEVSAAAGVGSEPFVLHGGRVYLTGPYNGGPFGLSIVIPAVAGPFDLGNVVQRASIRVDPNTAQVSVVSDALPQMVDSIEGLRSGIPVDLRNVSISINRPGFMFNPTSCEPLAVTGSLTGAQGTTVPVSSRFQAAGCQGLPFKPVFSVSTQAQTSKKQGASLTVNGVFPAGEANIHSVAVTLPKQLPARLTTIQQACTEAQFAENPAGCPTGSNRVEHRCRERDHADPREPCVGSGVSGVSWWCGVP
jgi:hypothetical protein